MFRAFVMDRIKRLGYRPFIVCEKWCTICQVVIQTSLKLLEEILVSNGRVRSLILLVVLSVVRASRVKVMFRGFPFNATSAIKNKVTPSRFARLFAFSPCRVGDYPVKCVF